MNGTVSTIVIVVILAVILFFAVKNSIPHFRGEGGCCGGSGKEKLIKPSKLERIIATKVIKIEGMRCENCNRRVQNALNQLISFSLTARATASVRRLRSLCSFLTSFPYA